MTGPECFTDPFVELQADRTMVNMSLDMSKAIEEVAIIVGGPRLAESVHEVAFPKDEDIAFPRSDAVLYLEEIRPGAAELVMQFFEEIGEERRAAEGRDVDRRLFRDKFAGPFRYMLGRGK